MAYAFNDDKSKRPINNIIEYKRKLTSSDNLNDITEAGIYSFNTNSVPVNSAYASACFLQVYVEVTGSTFMVVQILTRTTGSGQAFRGRYFSGGEYKWTSWAKVATESEITSLNTQVTTNKNNISTLTTQVTGIRNKGLAYPDFKSEPEWILNGVNINAGYSRRVTINKKGYYTIWLTSNVADRAVNGALTVNEWSLPFNVDGQDDTNSAFYPFNVGDIIEIYNMGNQQCSVAIQYFKQQTI